MIYERSPQWATFLDVDGVLYDTLPSYVKAWAAGFSAVNVEFTAQDVYEQEGRRGRDTVVWAFQDRMGREPRESEIEQVLRIKTEILAQQPEAPLMPGARELVQCAAKTGSLFLVTGSTRDGLKDRLQRDFGEYIPRSHIFDGRDYKHGKPHPEPYRLALKRAAVSTSASIVVENAPLGVESARAAGVRCVAVNTGLLEDRVFFEAGACCVYPDCLALARDWESVVGSSEPQQERERAAAAARAAAASATAG